MEAKSLFGSAFPVLERAMDLRSIKHNLTVSNIANMDTPNYRGFDLMVEVEMQKAMESAGDPLERTQPGHMRGDGGPDDPLLYTALSRPAYTSGMEGNNVDIDKAMAALAENSLKYNASAQILGKKFQGLKNAITGGGK